MASSSFSRSSSSSLDHRVRNCFSLPATDSLLAASSGSLLSLYFELCEGAFRKYLTYGGDFSSKNRGRENLTLFETKCAIISLTDRELTKNVIRQKLRHFNRIREMEDPSLHLDDNAGVSLETFRLIVRDVAASELNLNDLDKITFSEGDLFNRGNIKIEDFLLILSKIAPILSEKRGKDVFKALDPLDIGMATFPHYRHICATGTISGRAV